MTTGIDLVKEQIRVAAGEQLGYSHSDVRIDGHAIECRINAEDAQNNFIPSPGEITAYHPPGGIGIRTDSHLYTGHKVPPYYDSLIAKLIAHGRTREEAIVRMRRALDELTIGGVKTTTSLHQEILRDERFLAGQVDTGFLEA